jgi:hypothetical protein
MLHKPSVECPRPRRPNDTKGLFDRYAPETASAVVLITFDECTREQFGFCFLNLSHGMILEFTFLTLATDPLGRDRPTSSSIEYGWWYGLSSSEFSRARPPVVTSPVRSSILQRLKSQKRAIVPTTTTGIDDRGSHGNAGGQ